MCSKKRLDKLSNICSDWIKKQQKIYLPEFKYIFMYYIMYWKIAAQQKNVLTLDVLFIGKQEKQMKINGNKS